MSTVDTYLVIYHESQRIGDVTFEGHGCFGEHVSKVHFSSFESRLSPTDELLICDSDLQECKDVVSSVAP